MSDFIELTPDNFDGSDQRKNKFRSDSSIQGIDFSSYKTPIFKEKTYGKPWVSCGHDNKWPLFLIDVKNKCAIHAAILDNVTRQVCGEGMHVEDSEDKDQLAEMNEFLKKSKINKLIKRCTADYHLFGYFFIGITWSNDRTKIANLYHVDASSIRSGVPECIEGSPIKEIRSMWYSEDWTQSKKKEFQPEEIPVFDPNKRIDANCILMVRDYKSATRFYSLPSYNGAITACELNAAIGDYMLSSIKNGLSPSMIVNYNADASEEEKSVIYNQIKNLYSGEYGAGKFIMNFNQGKDSAITFDPIQTSNLSEIYSKLSDFCQNEIVRGHNLPNPILAGISIPGQLGLSNEIQQSSELYYNNKIAPVQILMEDTIQELLEVNDWSLKVFIKDSNPISFTYDDSTLLNILTVDELRKRIGYIPLSKTDITNLAVNIKDATKAPVAGSVEPKTEEGMSDDEPAAPTNELLRGMTGRQSQNLMRIVRQYNQKKMTREQATIMLSSGYGLSAEHVEAFLVDDTDDENEHAVPSPAYKGYNKNEINN